MAIQWYTKSVKGGTKKMTNQETFKNSMAELKAKKAAKYEREPERHLYDEGKISWPEYLKRAKERKEQERAKFDGCKAYALYEAGLITYDEFLVKTKEGV